MRIFISGGCKNGKSTIAQQLAKIQQNGPGGFDLKCAEASKKIANASTRFFAKPEVQFQAKPLYYVATMSSADREDDARILRHKQERAGWGFATVEQPRSIEEILTKCDTGGSFLLDSLTALLANEMFSASGEVDEYACRRIAGGLTDVLRKVENIVIVSDYIYSDAILYDPVTESYREMLASLDRLAARLCDMVLEAAYTQIIVHKGGDMYKKVCVEAI